MQEVLEKLGLTQGEIKVYLSLTKLGNVTTGPIVDDSNISKSKVYEILDRLTKKGLVSQIIDEGIKKFQAVHPRKLLDIQKEKAEEIQQLGKEIEVNLPLLESFYDSIKEKQQVTVLKGYQGLKTIFRDILHTCEKGDFYYVFVATEVPDRFKPFIAELDDERAKKGIKHKIIFDKKVAQKHVNLSRKRANTEVKVIGSEFHTPAVFNLYKNKSAILLWSKDPIGIVIENTEITESFKKYFDVLWALAK